jgi:hypothetical protein
MTLWRRFVGAIALFLSVGGIAACIGGIIGMWMLCHHLSGKVHQITAGLEGGLQRVSVATQNVQRAVEKARGDVAKVRNESAGLGNDRVKSSRESRTLRTLIQQQIGPGIEDLGGRMATLADTAAAVASVLQSFQDLPANRTGRIPPDQWERWTDEVQRLSATLRRLEGVVGNENKETNGQEVAGATSEVDLALQRCQAKVDDWQAYVDAASADVPRVKAEVLGWLTLAAIAVTLVLGWMAVGQFSLCAHVLRWCRGA